MEIVTAFWTAAFQPFHVSLWHCSFTWASASPAGREPDTSLLGCIRKFCGFWVGRMVWNPKTWLLGHDLLQFHSSAYSVQLLLFFFICPSSVVPSPGQEGHGELPRDHMHGIWLSGKQKNWLATLLPCGAASSWVLPGSHLCLLSTYWFLLHFPSYFEVVNRVQEVIGNGCYQIQVDGQTWSMVSWTSFH